MRLRPLPMLIFGSRWLQLPLYVGLIVAQVRLCHPVPEGALAPVVACATSFTEQQIMLVVLGLIDVVMISNLLVMVIVGGYETFVSRLNLEGHPDEPEWLSHVNASVLKIKLAMAIIGISSIHLLRTFIEAGNLGTGRHQLHRDRRDVADHHPRAVHPLGHRHRLGRENLQRIRAGGSRSKASQALTGPRAATSRERCRRAIGFTILALTIALSAHPAPAADAAFTQFIASLWPEAQQRGRLTRDVRHRDAQPRAGPDAARSRDSRPQAASRAAGRVRADAGGLPEGSEHRPAGRARAATSGRSTATRWSASSASSACPATIVLAIWARETDYGRFNAAYNAIRMLATQAYAGRRKEQFREEFVLALKMIQDGHGTRRCARPGPARSG